MRILRQRRRGIRFAFGWLSVLVFVVPLFLPQAVSAETKTLVWERLDVDITVQPDGTFVVRETQVIWFVSGTFTHGYRSIPTDRLSRITDVQVWEDGQPCRVEVDESGDEFEIRWDLLEPRQESEHTYVVQYVVHGGLRYCQGGDQLWWKAVFPARLFPVMASRVTVRLPDGAIAQKAAAYFTEATVSGVGTDTVVFEAVEVIDPGQEFEVRVQFPHGIVAGRPSAWQIQEDYRPLFNLIAGVIGALLLISGPLGVLLLWFVRGRDPRVVLPADYLDEPPSDAPPGVAGTLVDEQADLRDILATVVDLARRGYMIIEETSGDFVFERTGKPDDDLAPFEKRVLKLLTPSKGKKKKLSQLRNRFYRSIPKITEELYDEIVRRGFFRSRPDRVRKRYTRLGIASLVASAAVGCLLAVFLAKYTDAALCPSVGLVGMTIPLFVVARYMPVKTRKGAEEAARWRAFKRYLQEIERYTDLKEAVDRFGDYLPYAVAFGIDRSWIRKFQRLGDEQALVYVPWYIPVGGWGPVADVAGGTGGRPSGKAAPAQAPSLDRLSKGLGGGLDRMAKGLGSMLDTAATVFTSRPAPARASTSSGRSSSWSSSSWSSSSWSGGGWSGGGFSGGGGG
ncbi:MAG TPA: DUF2207 domain-containing protein, partial [Thermoflexia bacterium]|nr:DUF2207 domain-containing protein [Thermoflexia bacterium]